MHPILANLEKLRPLAASIGLTDEVEVDLGDHDVGRGLVQSVGRHRLPCKTIRGVAGLVIAAQPGADQEMPPRLSLTHVPTGLAVLQRFYDTADRSPRNSYARGEAFLRLPEGCAPARRRCALIELRRPYIVPVTVRGLTLLVKVGRAIAGLADWTREHPAAETDKWDVGLSVLERAWPILQPLADADDRAVHRSGTRLAWLERTKEV